MRPPRCNWWHVLFIHLYCLTHLLLDTMSAMLGNENVWLSITIPLTRIRVGLVDMGSDNERGRYNVTSSLIGWAQMICPQWFKLPKPIIKEYRDTYIWPAGHRSANQARWYICGLCELDRHQSVSCFVQVPTANTIPNRFLRQPLMWNSHAGCR